MDTHASIRQHGFYPSLVIRALDRVLGDEEPLAMVSQLEAAFDRSSMFRHLTVAVLTPTTLIQIHVDELDRGGAMTNTIITPTTRIHGASLTEVVTDAIHDGGSQLSELTMAINCGSQRRGEVELNQCDDPQCTADHGFTVHTFPEDFSMRFSAAADGEAALANAERFVDATLQVIKGNHAY